MNNKNRHRFNRKRIASRLALHIERREIELIGTRQSWDEWQFLEIQRINLFKQERG